MVLTDRGTPIEHFEYSRVDTEWAVLRLLASLGTSVGGPPTAHLVVEPGRCGDDLFSAPAHSGALERRLLTDQRHGSELLWRATFVMPLEIVEAPQALFKLIAGDVALALPTPWLRSLAAPQLALTGSRARNRDSSPYAFGNARQLAALVATVAVTATSLPAAAFAATGSGSAPTAAPVATFTTVASTTSTTGSAATAAPAAPSISSKRLIATAPRAVAASRSSRSSPLKLTHLFSAHGRPAGRATAQTTRTGTSCSTRVGSGAVALVPEPAAGPDRTLQVKCPLPSVHRQIPPHQAVPPKFPATPVSGKPAPTTSTTTPTPAPHKQKTRVAHPHPRTVSSRPTGGAPLTRPTTTPAPAPDPEPTSTSTGSVPTLSSAAPGFPAPKAWTGTVTADPALTGAVTNLSGLLSNGNRPPSFLIPIYMEAGRRFNVPWEVLAAINAIESDYGRNLNTSSAGAVGWMQFEPSTWAQYGMAVDGHSVPNPYDPRDAIFSAGRYLAAAGAAKDVARAVFAYNHASWYVDEVLSRARAIASHAQYERATVNKRGTFSVDFAAGTKRRAIVRYKGGVLSHYDRLIAAANMVSAANFPYLYGGGHEQPARWGPFDCSGSVSYVMQQAGYTVPTTVSGDIPSWKFPAGPGAVTIFYNPVHTFMRIGDRYFGTSGFARPGGGAGWFDVNRLPANYLATFREVHVPGLGVNSFAAGGQLPIVPFTHKRASSSPTWSSFKSQVRNWMSTLGSFPRA